MVDLYGNSLLSLVYDVHLIVIQQGKKVCKTTGFRRLLIQSLLNQLKGRKEGFSSIMATLVSYCKEMLILPSSDLGTIS